MRKIIGGKRVCGKTTALIKESYESGLHILCANRDMAKIVYSQSVNMNLIIPYPLTIDDLKTFGSSRIKGLLVDEVEMVMYAMFGIPVQTMSTSLRLKELPDGTMHRK